VYAFWWQGPVNSGNLVAFSTVMDFLDKNNGKRPSAENETGIILHLQNLSEQFLSYNPFLTVNGGNKNLNQFYLQMILVLYLPILISNILKMI
jgi:hypothetical protein